MNEKTKHTPGPWKAYGLAIYTEAKRKHWVSPRDPKQSLIANARENEDGDSESVVDNPPSMAEAEANAALIAAAPELLEALEGLVARIEYYSAIPTDQRPCIEQWEYTEGASEMANARAALAKARGEKGGAL